MESSNLNIKIKTMDNSLYELEIKRDITVIGLKKMIEEVKFNSFKKIE